MIANNAFTSAINSPIRAIKARAEIYSGSALAATYAHTDRLKSITIERVGEGKFFGFGFCQKLNLRLIDTRRELSITTANSVKIAFAANDEYIYTLPPFYVSEVHRDENTGELSVTAYDAIYSASSHTAAEVELSAYTTHEYAAACAALLGLTMRLEGFADDAAFYTTYESGANIEGSESVRELLTAIAEATQSIYYVNAAAELVFKRLDIDGAAVLAIDKERYITLDSGTNRRLAAITNTTELNDSVTAASTETGSTQYIRDNPFLELREDIAALLESALAAVGGLTINQYECTWRGNPLLEIGDKISLETKDGGTVYSYLLDDTLSYDGSLTQKSRWSYTGNEEETESNPVNLGEAIRRTYARVDKANKEITLLTSETAANAEQISSLLINTESISASVQDVQKETAAALESVNENVSTITSKVEAAITAEQMQITIQEELANGTNKVVTETGFTFDDAGLTVSRSDSEMSTQITDDGMTVSKSGEAVLTANNVGVNAVNLHATTYLIVGTNSRFEDYGSSRTGCFWIGGD